MALRRTEPSRRDAYRFRAPFYDATFGLVTAAARRAAVSRVNRQGGLHLDLGVGTGLSLVGYSDDVFAVGVDLSPHMLRIARVRTRAAGQPNCLGLVRMDAGQLAFADGLFDSAAALFVMTALADPAAALAEFARVMRPGGELVIVGHFSHGGGWRARLEAWERRLAAWLGAAPRLPMATILAQPGWVLTTSRRLPPFGLFTMLCLKREAPRAETPAEAPKDGERTAQEPSQGGGPA